MKITKHALASAALKAIADLVSAKDKAVRADTTQLFVDTYKESGIKSLDVMLEGVKVATTTLAIPKPHAVSVLNAPLFLAWVQENYPDAVVEYQPPPPPKEFSIAPAFTADLLERVCQCGYLWVDPDLGMEVPGLAKEPTATPSKYSITFADGGREALLGAWRGGALAGLDDLMLSDGNE